jgi:hypothetical protein
MSTTLTPDQERDAETYFASEEYLECRAQQIATQNANYFVRDGAPVDDEQLQEFLKTATIVDRAAPGAFGASFSIEFGFHDSGKSFMLIRNLSPENLHMLFLEGAGS